MPAMGSDDHNRTRLAEFVKRRRQALRLSTQKASEQAGISRQTWINVETAARKTNPANHGPIERVLGWTNDSIAAVLAGGEPTDIPALAAGEGESLSTRMREINDLPLTLAEKLRAVDVLVAMFKSSAGTEAAADDLDRPDTHSG
jgi:transcriptional regulator with XRE-family HTH domain